MKHFFLNFILGAAFVSLIVSVHAGTYAMAIVPSHASAATNVSLGVRKVVPAPKKVTPTADKTTPAKPKAVAPKPQAKVAVKNNITIGKIGVDSAILEGPTIATLNKGIWHLPGTSVPSRGGNVVISAHRYMWLPPSKKTFWDLDKLQKGDAIDVVWEGKKYRYLVAAISIVTPDRIDILKNTKEHKLTLFTCTPKFTSKYRLVVEAVPVEKQVRAAGN